MTAKPKGVGKLELRQEQPASPGRVVAIARFVQQLLEAAHPDLPEDAVTMVVTNYKLGAEARARSPEARGAITLITRLIERPGPTIKKHPEARPVARVFAAASPELREAAMHKPRRKKPIGRLTKDFIENMRKLAESEDESSLRGTQTVYTRVFRMGRLDDRKELRARIELDGTPHDIRVGDPGCAAALFDAARDGTIVQVRLDTTWERYGDGRLRPLPQQTTATAVEVWNPISGQDFLRTIGEDAFTDIDAFVVDLKKQ